MIRNFYPVPCLRQRTYLYLKYLIEFFCLVESICDSYSNVRKNKSKFPFPSLCFCRPTTRIFTSSWVQKCPPWGPRASQAVKSKAESPKRTHIRNKPMEQGIYWGKLRLGRMETRKKLKRLQGCNLNCLFSRSLIFRLAVRSNSLWAGFVLLSRAFFRRWRNRLVWNGGTLVWKLY